MNAVPLYAVNAVPLSLLYFLYTVPLSRSEFTLNTKPLSCSELIPYTVPLSRSECCSSFPH